MSLSHFFETLSHVRIGNIRWMWIWMRLGISLGLLVWMILRADLSKVWSSLTSIEILDLLALVIFGEIALMLTSLRWRALLPRFSFIELHLYMAAIRFYAFVLPGQMSGDVIRTLMLRNRHVDTGELTASVVMDRITGLLGLIITAVMGALTSPHVGEGGPLPSSLVWGLTGLFSVVVFVLFFTPALETLSRLLGWLKLRSYRTAQVWNFGVAVLHAWRDYVRRPQLILSAIGYSVLFQAACSAVMWWAARKMGIDVHYLDCCWIYGSVSLLVFIPVSIQGLGVREGTFVSLLGLLSVQQEQALALSLFMFSLAVLRSLISWVPLTVLQRQDNF